MNENVPKKKTKKWSSWIRLELIVLSVVVILIITLGIILITKYYRDINSVILDEYKLYQYFSGVKVEYDGEITLEREKNITKIVAKGQEVDSGDIPIYFQNVDNEVIFPDNMSIVFPTEKTKNYRTNYFTRISSDVVNNNEQAYISYKEKKTYLEESFLYNGEDLYFFPYSTTVTIDKKEYELSPLSYIIVTYKSNIEIYDKENDKYTIIDNHSDDVLTTVAGYTVNLSTDMIMYQNDNKLLIKNVDRLPLYNY